jgi:GTPase SAR1 family protein
MAAGGPSLRELAGLSGGAGKSISRTTFGDKLNGRSKPDWAFVEVFARACVEFAKRQPAQADPVELKLRLEELRPAYGRLSPRLAAVANKQRERSRGVRAARKELAVMSPGARYAAKRAAYLAELRDRYHHFEHTNALARRADSVPALPLLELFAPQWVHAEPPRTELPREVWRQLIANGHLSERDTPQDVDREQLDREFKAYADTPSRPVLEVISEPETRRIVVLGDPGAGKSTLAAYLTLALATPGFVSAGGHPLAPLADYLPVLLELRTYAPDMASRDFLDELAEPNKPGHPGLPRRMLKHYLEEDGRVLVVFDGLDEVFDQESREKIKWKIRNFARAHPRARVIVTSRRTDYEPERHILDQGKFAHYTLQDLDSKQVSAFIQNFYRATNPHHPAKASGLATRLLSAVTSSPAIAELAGNPLLLTTLALLGRGEELPRNRRTALKHMVEVLVARWSAEKHLEKYRQLGPGDIEKGRYLRATDKEALLRMVARHIQEGRPDGGGLDGNYLSSKKLIKVFTEFFQQAAGEAELEAKKDAETLVDQLRERDYILAKFGDETFGFVHRALLDYFAADDIYTRFIDRDISPQTIKRLFSNHSTAPEWQEVLLLLAAMLQPKFAEQAILALLRSNRHWYQSSDPLPRHVLLAIRCLGEARQLNLMRSASHAAADALIALLETVSEPSDYPLAVAVTQTLDRDVLPMLVGLGADWAGRSGYETWYLARGQFLRGDAPGFAATAAARIYVALLGRDESARERLYGLARRADSVIVRAAALEALAAGWPGLADTAELLTESAVRDPSWYVRREAVRTVAARWPDEPTTWDLLRERVTSDQAPEVCGTALRWLASVQRETQTARLIRAVGADPTYHGDVRAIAVTELAAGWHDDEHTSPWLWERSRDKDAHVRAAAAQALATGWHDDPETLHWLREHAILINERDSLVRVAVVHALATGWPERVDVVTLLKEKARTGGDDNPRVRQAAVEALAVGWRQDPETAPWLREYVVTEPDDDVRCAATQALATYWRDEHYTADLLEDRALEDKDWYVRATAIRALADLRRDGRQAGAWLRERATCDDVPYVRHVALNAAVTAWPKGQETFRWLAERAADGQEDLDVRGAAVRALAAGWRDENTLGLLRSVGDGDGVGDARTGAVRRVAVQAIAATWRDNEQTHAWLCRRATEDQSSAVRRTALQLLAADKRWHDEPGTVALLRDSAVHDKSPDVRRASIRTLSAGWPDTPATADWLRDRAFADNDRPGKLEVISALAADWHDDPATPRWLRHHAAADPDPYIQQAALDQLACGW